MAVTDGVQGLGIGRKLMEHHQSSRKPNQKIIIFNRRLIPAISLYEKIWF
jgi:GNAT superfamily N-acetyltransferase